MKKLLITLIIGVICHSATAQNKITRYCEIVTNVGSKDKAHIKFTQGEVDSLFSFKDGTIKNNLNKVSSLKSISDLLNYMSSLGWTLVTATMALWDGTNIRFYFKKEFDPSEISK
jgi:predicted PurR-regulated permease PerM